MTTKKTNDKEYKQIIRQHTKKKKNTTKQSKQTNDKEYKQKSNRIQKETNKNNVFWKQSAISDACIAFMFNINKSLRHSSFYLMILTFNFKP